MHNNTKQRLQKPNGKLVLKGHSDSEGPCHINMLMSKKRMKVVKEYLIVQAVKADKIFIKSYGESQPTATNRYPIGRELNRRIDISISE